MSHPLTLYSNPSCSKSQKALALLDQYNLPYTVINYVQKGLTESELLNILSILKVPAQEIIRISDLENYSLNPDSIASQDSIIASLIQKPILLQRPILLFKSEQGIIARPPEKIKAFLDIIKKHF